MKNNDFKNEIAVLTGRGTRWQDAGAWAAADVFQRGRAERRERQGPRPARG